MATAGGSLAGMAGNGPLRVVHADTSFLIRAGVTDVLLDRPGLELVAACGDGDALRAAIEREQPDVVITDVWMQPSDEEGAIGLAQRLRQTHPQIGVVVLTHHTEPQYARDLIAGGAQGRAYLLKDRIHDGTEFGAAIEVVARGGSMIDPAVLRSLLAFQLRSDDSPLSELTAREHEVLAAMASGKSNAAIAAELVLTKRAVEKHVGAIFLKLGLGDELPVSRRVTAVLLYLSDGDHGARNGAARGLAPERIRSGQ